VFVDEFHDVLNGHPERLPKWKKLGAQFSSMHMPIILMSATMPPHRVLDFVRPFGIRKGGINQLRSPTNRPEIGMHVVHVPPIAADRSLMHLVNALSKRLTKAERMLVFFMSQNETEAFASAARCAVYHSNLWEAGNTKAYNINSWDQGESKVMACTTAFAQGIDRSSVRYVVIFRPSYGLLTNNQMLGRAGRDRKESHVFFVTDQAGTIQCRRDTVQSRNKCENELEDLINGTTCRRYINTLCMDGDALATRCNDPPLGIPCDICSPNSDMQRFAMQAVEHPMRPLPFETQPSLPQTADRSLLPGKTPAACNTLPTSAFVPASSLLPLMSVSICNLILFRIAHSLFTQPPSPDEETMYDTGSEITSSQARMLDVLEAIHQPVSDSVRFNDAFVSKYNPRLWDLADIRLSHKLLVESGIDASKVVS
jgi:hypothetical protein